jgi:hypothetical protein
MTDRRPTNFELHLQRLEAEEPKAEEPRGILEIFERDADRPLSHDDDER